MAQVVAEGKKVSQRRCVTKKEAIEWERLEKERLKGRIIKIRSTSLLQWATAYLEYSQKQFVKLTFEEKRFAFKLFFQSVNPRLPVEKLMSIMVLKHLQSQESSRSGNSANKDRKNLRAAWEWGIRFLDLPERNPFDKIQRFAEERNERRVPGLDEFRKVFDVAEDGQDKLMLFMFLQTGARRDELFRLTWRDVNLKAREVTIKCRKNNIGEWKESRLPMSDDLCEMLKDQRKETGLLGHVFMCRTDDGQVVPYQYRQHWLKKLCAKARVEPFGFHGIRHLFASILASKNVPLVEIQKMLRHNSIQTTARYIHSLQENSREVLASLPGMNLEYEKSKSLQKAYTGR